MGGEGRLRPELLTSDQMVSPLLKFNLGHMQTFYFSRSPWWGEGNIPRPSFLFCE